MAVSGKCAAARRIFACATLLVAAPAAADGAPEADFDFPVLASPLEGDNTKPVLPAPRRWMEAKPSQVPIGGAGRLDFTPDATVLGVNAWTGGLGANAEVRLAFDRDGQPVDCTVLSTNTGWAAAPKDWDRETFVAGLCSEAMAKARFTYARWFDMPLDRGIVDVEIGMTRWLRPAMPVTLTSREEGHPVELTILWNGKGQPGCHADMFRLSRARDKVCAAFAASERGKAMMEGDGFKGARKVLVYVPGELGSGGAVSTGNVPVQNFGFGARWPQPQIDQASMLRHEDGNMVTRLDLSQIPVPRRFSLSARVSVILGIAPDGQVKTCRPLRSDTWPGIDNATCAALVGNGHFRFSEKPDWKALRYKRETVWWRTGD